MKSTEAEVNLERSAGEVAMQAGGRRPDLKDPHVVLSLLEADQVVAAKRQTRFGRRPISAGTNVLLWGLRAYVVLMMVIVVLSVLRALRGGQ
jgi:hypothetical protein